MSMKNTITITSKGQTTLPAAMRRKLGLEKSGGVLQISFDDSKGEMTVKKAATIVELSARISHYVKPGTVPVQNVNDYYQANRKAKQ